MNFIVVGTNHKCSPLKIREKIFFPGKKLKNALFALKERKGLRGAVILSTCNRTEIYASVENAGEGIREIIDFISGYHRVARELILPWFYVYEGERAMEHLVSVAAGVDSLIVGELQIAGQVKAAFYGAESAGFTDTFLKKMFCFAMSFAGRVRAETGISDGKVSVGSVAADFIKERTGESTARSILIIGVGKVTELVLKYLRDRSFSVVFISNRTYEKAKELAGHIGAEVVSFNELDHVIEEADIIITATASPHFIIKKETLAGKVGAGLLIVDLALPRDVDPRVKELENVELFCLEDLGAVIKRNMERKSARAKRAREIISTKVEELWEEFTESEREPALLP